MSLFGSVLQNARLSARQDVSNSQGSFRQQGQNDVCSILVGALISDSWFIETQHKT